MERSVGKLTNAVAFNRQSTKHLRSMYPCPHSRPQLTGGDGQDEVGVAPRHAVRHLAAQHLHVAADGHPDCRLVSGGAGPALGNARRRGSALCEDKRASRRDSTACCHVGAAGRTGSCVTFAKNISTLCCGPSAHLSIYRHSHNVGHAGQRQRVGQWLVEWRAPAGRQGAARQQAALQPVHGEALPLVNCRAGHKQELIRYKRS